MRLEEARRYSSFESCLAPGGRGWLDGGPMKFSLYLSDGSVFFCFRLCCSFVDVKTVRTTAS